MTVDIIDAPIIANLESKPDMRTQIGSANAQGKQNNPNRHPNETPALSSKVQTEETMKDWTRWELPIAAKARLGKGKVNDIKFTPDGTLLAVGTSIGVWLYDANTGEEITLLTEDSGTDRIQGRSYINVLAFSSDGDTLACGDLDGKIELWDLETRTLKSILGEIPRPVKALQFIAGNTNLVGAGGWTWDRKSGKTLLWNLTDNTQTPIVTALDQLGNESPFEFHVAISPNERFLAAAFVSVWDTDTGSELSTDRVENGGEKTSEAAICPDGSVFVTKDTNKINFRTQVVRLWDTNTRQLLSTLGDQEDSGFQAQVVFSADNKLLAVSSRKDNTIQIWDVPNRRTQCRLEGHTTAVYSMAFSPDNKTVVSSGWTTKDMTIRLWDTMTGTELATFPDQGAVAFAPDGNAFAGGSHIYSRNPTTGTYECGVRLEDISDPPTALTFSPDGSILVSGSRHGFIQLRDTITGKIISTLPGHTSYISVLVFSDDPTTLATAGEDGTILLWDWEEILDGIKVGE